MGAIMILSKRGANRICLRTHAEAVQVFKTYYTVKHWFRPGKHILYFSILLNWGTILIVLMYSLCNATTNYVHSLFIAATCFGRTWAIIRKHLLLGETIALYTMSFVPIGTSLLLLLICFIGYFYPIFLSSHFSAPFYYRSLVHILVLYTVSDILNI
jgi:hypothetical protein